MAANVPSAPSAALEYGNWSPAFFKPHSRSIGGIVAQVTIDEQASDDVQVTEHPVEQGAPIADHAFKRPANVSIRAGWSRQYAWDLSAETGVYGLLLSWQAALLPFDVYTGKRKYTNMLIERLQVVTDNHTEFALMATITCRQVIIVGTSTTDVTSMSNSASDQSDPSSTSLESDGGDKQATSVGTITNDVSTVDPITGLGYSVDPATGIVTQSEFGNPVASTPQAGAVNGQLTANGAQPPNNPTVQSPQSTGIMSP